MRTFLFVLGATIRQYCFPAGAVLLVLLSAVGAWAATSDSVIARCNVSLTLEQQGFYADALDQMQIAYGLAPQDYFVNLRLAWVLYLNQKYELSRRHYEAALNLSGGRSIEALLGLTLPQAALNDWDAVIASYQKILSLDPVHYTANLRLGQIYMNRGDATRAQMYLEKALLHYPGEYEANLSAGWTYEALGLKARGRACFERVLMMSPGDTSATRGLERVR